MQDNLYEAEKNFEALNNQLLEELPKLIEKCSSIFKKCFFLYLNVLKNIHENIRIQLFGLKKQVKIKKKYFIFSLSQLHYLL